MIKAVLMPEQAYFYQDRTLLENKGNEPLDGCLFLPASQEFPDDIESDEVYGWMMAFMVSIDDWYDFQ